MVLRFIFSFLFCGLCFGKNFTILHTNDWQSRLLGFSPSLEYKPKETGDGTIGGVARLATLIEQKRQIAKNVGPVLLLDSGDFTMGTLFHTVTREKGYELQLLQMLGYDAVTFGNHEFDFRVSGLVQMIQAAQSKVDKIPPILATNIVFAKDDPRDDDLAKMMKDGTLKRYMVIEKDGIRFGLLGVLGKDAREVAPESRPVTFSDVIPTAQETIDILRSQLKADVVIMLSHSGILPDSKGGWRGEEVEFAQQLSGLDIIVGGHSHTPLEKPIVVNGIPIVQAGSELRFLGELTMDYNAQSQGRKVQMVHYELYPVDDKIIGREDITQKVEEAKEAITTSVLAPHGLTFDQPIAETSTTHDRGQNSHYLGTLVAESLKVAARADIGFMANGSIRDDIAPGRSGIQSVEDLFRIIPLGIGVIDDQIGYPVVKLHLTARELKSVMEILLFAYKLRGDSYFPRFSGVQALYNSYRMPLDQIYEMTLIKSDGTKEPLDPLDETKLYSVGTTSYIGSFLWLIEKMSFGIYKVQPKNEDGTILADMKDAIVDGDPNKDGVQEFKAWVAFLNHVKTLPDLNGDGIPDISGESLNPLLETPTLAPQALFKNATWIQWSGFLALCLLVTLFVGIITKICRWVSNRTATNSSRKTLRA